MATKVYKEGYMVIVEEPLQPQRKYTLAKNCRFGFDGDTCWIIDLEDNVYIYNDLYSNMLDSAGNPVGNKEFVEDYLLEIIGDSSESTTPTTGAIKFYEDFEGTTLNAYKWDKTNTDPTVVSMGQVSDKFKFETLIDANTTSGNNNICTNSSNKFTISATPLVFGFDIDASDQLGSSFNIGFTKTNPVGSALDDHISFIGDVTTAGQVRSQVKEGGVSQDVQAWALDISTTKTIKMVLDSTDVTFYYWGGSSWTQASTYAHASSGDFFLYFFVRVRVQGSIGDTWNFDNLTVTEEDYTTQYPV